MVEDIVKGLLILRRYTGENFSVYAEHNLIYAGAEVKEEGLSTYDQQLMEAAGWHFEDGWYHLV